MPENKPRRLDEVVSLFAPEGDNDGRWFLVEHQLEQTIISARVIVGSLRIITARPENEEERQIADDCLSYMKPMLCDILEARASFQSYLSDTDVPDRISNMEVQEHD